MPLLNRTRLPRSWFTDEGRWVLLRSKRWHRPLKIGQGEFKALVAWAAVLTRCEELARRMEVLDLTDNTGVAGIKVRGRSPRYPLNVEARHIAAAELLLDMRLDDLHNLTLQLPHAAIMCCRPCFHGRRLATKVHEAVVYAFHVHFRLLDTGLSHSHGLCCIVDEEVVLQG